MASTEGTGLCNQELLHPTRTRPALHRASLPDYAAACTSFARFSISPIVFSFTTNVSSSG